MPSFDWRRVPSRYFGEVWVPIVEVQLQSVTGNFKPAAACVDSGAIVSLLRRSLADELGLDLKSGRHVWLRSVGGSRVEAFVHDLTIRFAENEQTAKVPFAISERDSAPNLIGRVGVLDQYRIEFDPVGRLTRIEPLPA